MKLRTSAATILFPAARGSLREMEQTLAYLGSRVDMVEFFYEGEDDRKVGRLLEQNGLAGLLIGVIPLKEQGLSLCSLDEENRNAAVGTVRRCIDRARVLGCESVMLCSGNHPGDHRQIAPCLDAFVHSMDEIWTYARQGSDPPHLLLEPCDSVMDARHLLGPTAAVVEVARRVGEFCDEFSLTMDTAHVAEEGEDFAQAMELAHPYCHHIHFANCMVVHPSDPLYGDKHVAFDYPGSAWPYQRLEQLFRQLCQQYQQRDQLDIALESLCRMDNPYENFERIMAQMPWFFQKMR